MPFVSRDRISPTTALAITLGYFRLRMSEVILHIFKPWYIQDGMNLQAVFLAFLVCGVVLSAGCTQQEAPPMPTTSPTPTALLPDLSPVPTDTVPPEYSVHVTVSRNTYSFNPLVRVEFRGGRGMGLVSSVDAEVIRMDGSTGTARLEEPSIGEYMELLGTTGKDRVIVTATMMNGERYRIYDQVMEFRA